MDDPNITMEEYIRLREEKARRRAIVFNDTLTSEAALSCEPTVSSLNNDEIDFRISFDESDDEDCMVIFDKNSFSYKIISSNDLKTDLENDNDKVNMPSLPSPEPTDNDDDKVDIEHSSRDLSFKPLPDVINTYVGAYAHGSNKLLETRINTAYPGEWIRRIDFLYSLGPRERNINEYWWRINESGNLEVLES
ncbi:hypothetical protein Tco_0092893 [Tanacetum coccineum]